MKAPDKLYISPLIYETRLYEIPDEESVEYIRKDALLEWLKEKVLELEPLSIIDAGRWGQMNAFKQVIDKLHEM